MLPTSKEELIICLEKVGGFENYVSGKGMIADQLLDNKNSQLNLIADNMLVLEGSLNSFHWQFHIYCEDGKQPTIEGIYQEREEELFREDVTDGEAEAGQHATAVERVSAVEQVAVVRR